VRLLLDLLDGGVKLTQAGRLPRSVVQAVQEQRPAWAFRDGRPARTEDDLRPLSELHSLLRAAGLLRKTKGVVTPTKAAQSDKETLERLRAALFGGDFTGTLRRFLLERLAVAGTAPERDRAGRGALRRTGLDGPGRPARCHGPGADARRLGRPAVVGRGRRGRGGPCPRGAVEHHRDGAGAAQQLTGVRLQAKEGRRAPEGMSTGAQRACALQSGR
jgi:hypothetical protein